MNFNCHNPAKYINNINIKHNSTNDSGKDNDNHNIT